jgi:predicted permease
VAAQVALSLVLLTGSGLFLRSLVHMVNAPLGFTVDGVALASVNLGLARFDAPRAASFYDQALTRVRELPQVKTAAWGNIVPTVGGMMMGGEVESYRPAPGEDVTFGTALVGPDYFAAVGTRILSGRPFNENDDASAPAVVIVNETAARKYWNGEPLGRRVKMGGKWATIVGVAENAISETIGEKPAPFLYSSFDQPSGSAFGVESAHLFVRSDGDPEDLLPMLAGELRAVDASAPVYDVRTFEEAVRGLAMPQRMGVSLMGLFSLLALVLATVGIYGVASYVAALRTREIGIRMALGAGRTEITRLIMDQGARPVAVGIAAGLGLALWAGQLATAFLFDVSPRDPLTLAIVAAVLGSVALGATCIPAYRAARINPTAALRHE